MSRLRSTLVIPGGETSKQIKAYHCVILFSLSEKLTKVNPTALGLLAALVIPDGEVNKQIKASSLRDAFFISTKLAKVNF